MADLEITDSLVGQKVCNPARPEWGQGTVLRIQTSPVGGQPVYRVSIQFSTGHRVIQVPPGRLACPQAGPQREAGWLDKAARQTTDDRLAALPESVREFLGTSAQRLVVIARLYEVGDDATSLMTWARSQSGVADPMSLWSRDEIRVAYDEFCRRRDTLLREIVAAIRRTSGPAALGEAWKEVPDAARERMQAIVTRDR